jgi:murein DD-endopeptidase MepM/ murein hydrolase activator NlpD
MWRFPPVSPVVVTSSFGPRTIAGVAGFHDGIDLRAPEGTPLVAPDDGEIEHTANAGSCGQQIAMRLVSGLRVVFCHLSAVLVQPGMSVAAGTVIGATGSTGTVTGPHLHLSVKRILPTGGLSAALDPAPLLGGGGGGGAVVLALLVGAAVLFRGA